jgi:hypothetical protein
MVSETNNILNRKVMFSSLKESFKSNPDSRQKNYGMNWAIKPHTSANGISDMESTGLTFQPTLTDSIITLGFHTPTTCALATFAFLIRLFVYDINTNSTNNNMSVIVFWMTSLF